jgi:hypothetical protein
MVFDDGRHNMVPRLIKWRGEYWMVFRNGENHRSGDGRILLIRSPDLETWTSPRVVIDTPLDDRDPSIFEWNDRLHVVSLSVDRLWADPSNPWGEVRAQGGCRCYLTRTDDGGNWSEPLQVLPDNYVIWWPTVAEGRQYAGVQRRVPDSASWQGEATRAREQGRLGFDRGPRFVNHVDRQAELWSSEDGASWVQVGIIDDADQASETALAVLPDGRMVAMVRHDNHDSPLRERSRPEILLADPPYREWRPILRFDFPNNGPCLGLIGDTLVTCSRAFFEDERTPLNSDTCRSRVRGMIMGTIDLDGERWQAGLSIPHRTGPVPAGQGGGRPDSFPDVSYAWFLDRGGGRFLMAHYEGFKGSPSQIWLSHLRL